MSYFVVLPLGQCISDALSGVVVCFQVTDECIDMLRGLLKPAPEQRFTIEKIMEHPWFNKKLPPQVRQCAAGAFSVYMVPVVLFLCVSNVSSFGCFLAKRVYADGCSLWVCETS